MRIALIQDFLRVGGTETQTVALANAFAAAGNATLVTTFRPGGPLEDDLAPEVRRIALQRRDLGLDWFAPGLVATAREFRPEIVLLMGRMANCHGWRLARALPGTPVVATVRTGKTFPWWFRKTMRCAAAIVANSNEAADRCARQCSLPREKIEVIHNAAVRIAAPSLSREKIRRRLGTPHDAIVFLCVAMMRPGKGHADLIRAFAAADLPADSELWLAGDGAERPTAEATARSLGLGSRVRFLGRRDDVPDLCAAADVAVLASRVESLPNFLVEAQWHGLPVVALKTAGVGETFADGESGILIASLDTADLPNALERLARDPTLRGKLSRRAREFAREHFDPARQNQRYLDLFQRLRDRATA